MRSRCVVVPLLVAAALATAARPIAAAPATERPPRLAPPRAANACARLTVLVNLTFDPAIDAGPIREAAQGEATAIWQEYNVDLVWPGTDATPTVRLDAHVTWHQAGGAGGPASVFGSAVVGQAVVNPAASNGPITVSLDAIDAVVGPDVNQPTKLHDAAVARVLGRVLAHEIGHVLLGPPSYHDSYGLMRPTFHSLDVAGRVRSPFHLADRSIARIRERVGELQTANAGGKCGGCSARNASEQGHNRAQPSVSS